MKPSTIAFRCALGCAAALFACSDASAICTVFNAPPPRYVGDTASDGACTDNTIQSAITFIKNAGYVCPAKIYVTREHLYASQHLTIDNIPGGLAILGKGDGVHCGSTDVQICGPDTGCPPPPTQSLVTIDGGYQEGGQSHFPEWMRESMQRGLRREVTLTPFPAYGSSNTQFAAITRLKADGSADDEFGTLGKRTYDFALSSPTEQIFLGVALQGTQLIAAGASALGDNPPAEIDDIVVRLENDLIFADSFDQSP